MVHSWHPPRPVQPHRRLAGWRLSPAFVEGTERRSATQLPTGSARVADCLEVRDSKVEPLLIADEKAELEAKTLMQLLVDGIPSASVWDRCGPCSDGFASGERDEGQRRAQLLTEAVVGEGPGLAHMRRDHVAVVDPMLLRAAQSRKALAVSFTSVVSWWVCSSSIVCSSLGHLEKSICEFGALSE